MDQDELRQALTLGLAQLRQRQADADTMVQVVQALLSTDRVRHLSAELVEGNPYPAMGNCSEVPGAFCRLGDD